jgi:Protein of unknown function (DUF1036)
MSISDIPRQELCILVANFGRGLCDDPQRCEALLRDYCGTYRREITLLVNAMREQVPAELMSTEGKVPYEILRSRLVKKLEENLAITTEAAQWSVDAWAAALDINTPSASPSNSSSLSVNSGGTRVEQYNSGGNYPAGTPDSGYKPTEVAGSGNPNTGGNLGAAAAHNSGGYNPGGYNSGGYNNPSANNSNNYSGGASTQIRPDLTPPANPNTYPPSPYPAAAPPPSGGGSKPNYLLFGILGGVGALGLAALIGIAAMIGNSGSPEMRAALKEAKAMRINGQYSDCIDTLKEYNEFNDVKKVLNLCRLDLAQQHAKDGKLLQAIRDAKLISSAPDTKTYDRARALIADWSEGREIKFRNSCRHPIEIAIYFADPKSSTNKPKADGWWKLDPNDFSYLSDKGQRIRVLDTVYYYAQSTDRSGWFWEGDKNVTLGGKTYRMRDMQPKIDPKDGSFVQTLTCNPR